MTSMQIPAMLMRGGTSKGLFLLATDLPTDQQRRDALLLRALGSPDPEGLQIDGLGGGNSSTSKVVILSRSQQPGHEVDYLFGQVSTRRPEIDWSGSCGDLAAAVGPAAIRLGLIEATETGVAEVRIWQVNTAKTIVAQVPVQQGQPRESGSFVLDGVPFPGAEIQLEYHAPTQPGALLPTRHALNVLDVPGLDTLEATLINAGRPAVLVDAEALGLHGDELRSELSEDARLRQYCEAIRANAAVAMGLSRTPADALRNPATLPRLIYLARPLDYPLNSGKIIQYNQIDLCVRVIRDGELQAALSGNDAITLAAAAAIPGTLSSRLLDGPRERVCYGHPSGTVTLGARACRTPSGWGIQHMTMSRTARRLMEGSVIIPDA